MLGVCNRYARNSQDAEDILQDSFIKVFDKVHQFKFEGSFEGWIRKIVVNTALKKYSVRRYEKEVDGYEIKERDEGNIEPTAYSQLSEKDLMNLINRLPDGYRLIFNLYVIEGYQHEEIAEMLKIHRIEIKFDCQIRTAFRRIIQSLFSVSGILGALLWNE